MSPKAVAKYEDQIRSDANILIDRFIDNGECEFVGDFGSKLPGWAFFKNVLGVPIDDLDMLVTGVENGTFAPPEERAGHFAEVFDYLGKYLALRKDEPPRVIWSMSSPRGRIRRRPTCALGRPRQHLG